MYKQYFLKQKLINKIGVIITNEPLKGLLDDMKSYEIDYIMTRKVNQDIIENLFSFLKGMCGSSYNNITALQFKY